MNAFLRLAVAVVIAVPLAAQVWQTRSPAIGASVVADATHGRVLLQGGNLGWFTSTTNRSVWFDGIRFEPAGLPGAASPPLAGAMAHDPARGRTVWHGGTVGSMQTWEHDGAVWTQAVAIAPPTPGELVWHAALARVLLVAIDSTTWTWDGAAWTQLVPASPPPGRTGFGLAYDEARQCTVLLGGVTSTGVTLADTWEFDGLNWSQVTPMHAPFAGRATLAFDRVRQRIVARVTDPSQFATWEFDGVDWSTIPIAVNAPAALGARLVTSPLSGACWLVEGWLPAGNSVRIRELQGQAWLPLAGCQQPDGVYGSAVAVDTRRDVVWRHGGRLADNPFLDTDVAWLRFGESWLEHVAVPRPSARAFHGMVYDPGRDRLVLFGGKQGNSPLGDTWELHAGQWSLRSGPGPSARARFGMVHDPVRARTVLFGGQGTGYLGDVWTSTANGWAAWPLVGGPSPRAGHAMAYDAANDRIVVFGGEGPAGVLGDTWSLTDAGWTQLAPTVAPLPCHGAAMAYDPYAGQVTLVGGRAGNTSYADVWRLHGGQWSLGPPLPASEGTWHAAALVAVPARRRLELLFGAHVWSFVFGIVDARRFDTWELVSDGQPRAAAHGSGCPGSAGVPFLAPAPGSVPMLGGTFTVQLAGAPAAPGLALLAVGGGIATFAGEPLPLPLAGLGLPGCHLWVAPELLLASNVTGGACAWSFALPANPALAGAVVAMQSVVPDAGLATFGTVSNAVVGEAW
ncbi:MAG: hypothetical protein JNK15_06975 [Planctomycetes bacterium]|nr:hypothetical protein [Planctomycetota bacterium]